MSYKTQGQPSLNVLTNVEITDISNNNLLQYNSTSGIWENGNDINLDEIDCRVLRVSETADIVGRLANQGVASFVNDEFIFQNGVSNLGDTLYIDNQNNRVGINISNPEEDLEVDGSIQIDSANIARLKYQKSGQDPHALGEIDGEEDGTNGGDLQFFTKVDGGSVSEKLRINNIGAIGIGGTNFGIQGQVLTSNGSGSSVSWGNSTPYYLNVGFNYDGTGDNHVDFNSNTEFYPSDETDWELNTLRYASQYPSGDLPTSGSNKGYWTPSETGLYLVNVRLAFNNTQDELHEYNVRLTKEIIGLAGEEEWVRQIFRADSSDEDFRYLSVSFSTVVRVETVGASGERYRIKILVKTNAGNVELYKSVNLTCMEITKLA